MNESNKHFTFPVHSIVLLIGPSNCGKSYFATNYLIPQLKKFSSEKRELNVQYLNANNI